MRQPIANETVTVDKTYTAKFETWRKRPGAIQITWRNAAGTPNGTLAVGFRLEGDAATEHLFANQTTIAINAVSGTALLDVQLFTEDVQLIYTKNDITSIDFLITSMT